MLLGFVHPMDSCSALFSDCSAVSDGAFAPGADGVREVVPHHCTLLSAEWKRKKKDAYHNSSLLAYLVPVRFHRIV